jgi:hypothetical protein
MESFIGIPYLKEHIRKRLDILEIALKKCNNYDDAVRVNGAISELGMLLDTIREYEFK